MSETIETNKLFIWNLHWNVRRQELKEFFWQRWEVAYASVSLDRETRRSRWFGFVTFVNSEDAEKAQKECAWKMLHEREIYVDFARARPDSWAEETEENNEEQVEEEEQEQQQE